MGSGFADSTRTVGTVGLTIVRITTDQGLDGIGLTYHEVGGGAVRRLILDDIAPTIDGRDPLETEVIWTELFHDLRGVGRKCLLFGAISAVDIVQAGGARAGGYTEMLKIPDLPGLGLFPDLDFLRENDEAPD